MYAHSRIHKFVQEKFLLYNLRLYKYFLVEIVGFLKASYKWDVVVKKPASKAGGLYLQIRQYLQMHYVLLDTEYHCNCMPNVVIGHHARCHRYKNSLDRF